METFLLVVALFGSVGSMGQIEGAGTVIMPVEYKSKDACKKAADAFLGPPALATARVNVVAYCIPK